MADDPVANGRDDSEKRRGNTPAEDDRAPSIGELMTLSQAARRLPSRRGGRPTHPSTLHRWAQFGRNGVRLKTLIVGDTRCTTEVWLLDFIKAVTAAKEGQNK